MTDKRYHRKQNELPGLQSMQMAIHHDLYEPYECPMSETWWYLESGQLKRTPEEDERCTKALIEREKAMWLDVPPAGYDNEMITDYV